MLKGPKRSCSHVLYRAEKLMWNLHSFSWDHQLGSLDYNEGVERIAREIAELSKGVGQKVLDLGCGTGNFAVALADTSDVTCVDYAGWMLSKARSKFARAGRGGKFHCIDFNTRLPFGDAEFDHVLCIAALQCAVQPPVFLREIRRVLKPEGSFIAVFRDQSFEDSRKYKNAVPLSFPVRILIRIKLLGGQSNWAQHYTARSLGESLRQSGFQVMRFEPFYPQTQMVVACAEHATGRQVGSFLEVQPVAAWQLGHFGG